jgi:hypothetical protein
VIEHRLPLDQTEIERILGILNRASWVKAVMYPGVVQPDEISVSTTDGKSWRIARPLHLVRLMFHYQKPRP